MTTKSCGCTTETCGCCEGIQALTPQSTINRPGLSALSYRVGTHGAFLETMKARLTTMTVDVPSADGQTTETYTPLRDLTTRDSGDFSIALLDGWATIADVLTFYQERIANEGFLRTATERRSILELARLLGYDLRPGVAATVYLAYTIDEDLSVTPPKAITTTIPKGSRVQSVPGPGELPQSFETSDDIEARSTWNALRPRMTQPQTKNSIQTSGLFLNGIDTNLKANDPLLIDFGTGDPELFRIIGLAQDPAANRTVVNLQEWDGRSTAVTNLVQDAQSITSQVLLESLLKPASIPPANSTQLSRDLKSSLTAKADAGLQLLSTFHPALGHLLPTALANAKVTPESGTRVYALRVKASLFGHNAPLKPTGFDENKVLTAEEWSVGDVLHSEEFVADSGDLKVRGDSSVVYLDASYEKIVSGSWVVVDSSAAASNDQTQLHAATPQPVIAKANNPQANISRAAYGITGKTTRVALEDPSDSAKVKEWLEFNPPSPPVITIREAAVALLPPSNDFQIIRRTVVYAQSEELALAEEPIFDPVCDGKDTPIELDGLYDGLQSGRWLIVAGERADIPGVTGVRAGELVMIEGVNQDLSMVPTKSDDTKDAKTAPLAGDKIHTFLQLSDKLAYCYKRDTLVIYGNVVKATHGETRNETLGSGDGSQSLQSFTLKQPPLTFVSAPNPTGVDSTLEVFVNSVQWHETDTLAGLGPKDRKFITKTDDTDKTTVIFGNGEQGARLPTGMANVTSVYRNGIGQPGNVKAEQISLLQTRPLGAKSVINPLPATSGADKENRDQARENAPLAVMSLDRLVSVQDYADFSRTFAGIGKAAARKLSDTKRQLVHVTIAGADDIPIDETSDLFQNLLIALRKFGDLDLPVQVQIRELVVLVLSANVRLAADYQWEPVVTAIRATLLDTFGFQKRALGQPVLLSEVISAIQNTDGVEYVDVDAFGGVPEKIAETDGTRSLLSLDQIAAAVQQIVNPRQVLILRRNAGRAESVPAARVPVNLADFENGALRPAQLAMFTGAVPDTLILNQIK